MSETMMQRVYAALLPVLLLGLMTLPTGNTAHANGVANGVLDGQVAELETRTSEFRMAQALTPEERARRRAARQQRRKERAAGNGRALTPEERAKRRAARQQRRKERAVGNGQARPKKPKQNRQARPNRPTPRAAQPAKPAQPARPTRRAAPPPTVAAQPQVAAPRKKRRRGFGKLKRSVGKFFKRTGRKIHRTFKRERDAERRDAFERRETRRRRRFDEQRFRDRRFTDRDVPRRFDDRRRRSYDDRRWIEPDVRRSRSEIRVRERARWRQRRRDERRAWRRDRRRAINSRRHVIRDRRHRNRFRRGRSIYYLPPAGIALGAGLYALDSSRASHDDYVGTFMAPPVRALPRRYSLDDIVTDPELRSAVRSVNIDVLTFPSGSARIPAGQVGRLEDLADAIHATLRRRRDEVFLIAGHTDAVGAFDSNLDLSERRAAAVQQALIDEFNVPPENLESVGYGEQYLRIDTDGPDRRNRRVVVRAIGALLARR